MAAAGRHDREFIMRLLGKSGWKFSRKLCAFYPELQNNPLRADPGAWGFTECNLFAFGALRNWRLPPPRMLCQKSVAMQLRSNHPSRHSSGRKKEGDALCYNLRALSVSNAIVILHPGFKIKCVVRYFRFSTLRGSMLIKSCRRQCSLHWKFETEWKMPTTQVFSFSVAIAQVAASGCRVHSLTTWPSP